MDKTEQLKIVNKILIIDKYGLDHPEEFYNIPIEYINQLSYRQINKIYSEYYLTTYCEGVNNLKNFFTTVSVVDIINSWNKAKVCIKNNIDYLQLPRLNEFDEAFIRAALKAYDIDNLGEQLSSFNSPGKFLPDPQKFEVDYRSYYTPLIIGEHTKVIL